MTPGTMIIYNIRAPCSMQQAGGRRLRATQRLDVPAGRCAQRQHPRHTHQPEIPRAGSGAGGLRPYRCASHGRRRLQRLVQVLQIPVEWSEAFINASGVVGPECGGYPSFGYGGVAIGGWQDKVHGPRAMYTQRGRPQPLAPWPCTRPMPPSLSFRVLVDRSLVKSFALGGRAYFANTFVVGNIIGSTAVSIVWQPPARAPSEAGTVAEAAVVPTISVQVFEMETGFIEMEAGRAVVQ